MLTGTRAFAGLDVQDTFMAIMRDEPDWARLPARLSPALGAYIRRCLQKDPRQRIHDIADVRLALDGAFDVQAEVDKSATTRSSSPQPWRRSLSWVLATLMVSIV